MRDRSGVDPFDHDAGGGEGYVYTTSDQFSTRHVLARHFELIKNMGRLEGRSIIDIGCGDGFSTLRFFDSAHPSKMAGVDPAPNAIKVADAKKGERPILFRVLTDNHVPFEDGSFDIAIIQGVLHHADDPPAIVKEALRVASEVVILEPNGLNSGLKVLEKTSPYHREHNERSYSRRRLRRWVEDAGGKIAEEKFAVFVPIFSPDWLAKTMKALEPAVEATPGLRAIACSVFVLRATH